MSEDKPDRLAFFPGMPKLTLRVKARLRQYLPRSVLSLQVDESPFFDRGETTSYAVYVDDHAIGRFTVRSVDGFVERKFFCFPAAEMALPEGAVVAGSFGEDASRLSDSLRVLQEHLSLPLVWLNLKADAYAAEFEATSHPRFYDPEGVYQRGNVQILTGLTAVFAVLPSILADRPPYLDSSKDEAQSSDAPSFRLGITSPLQRHRLSMRRKCAIGASVLFTLSFWVITIGFFYLGEGWLEPGLLPRIGLIAALLLASFLGFILLFLLVVAIRTGIRSATRI